MKYSLLLFLVAFLMPACQQNHTASAIELNQGERWQVNIEMMPAIKASRDLLQQYAESGDTDYQALATGLKKNNTQLIATCTMQGKSHDELHKWLHPQLELVTKLESASPEEAPAIVAQLQASFQTFAQYFQ